MCTTSLWRRHGAVHIALALVFAAMLAPPLQATFPDDEEWGNRSKIIPELVSRRPWVYRFRNVFDARQSAAVRRLVVDAIAFFNDTAPDGSLRPGARALARGDARRPRYRMQNERQLSLYFPDPPPVMARLYRRVAAVAGVHPRSVEAIYHLYAPGALPANLHLDNFNKFLFPHRYASLSMFFDDADDGGTVFPLRQPLGGDAGSAAAPAAEGFKGACEDEIEHWHRLINETRMHQGTDGYSFRRVEEDERQPFRRWAFETSIRMCLGGRSAQEPVVPILGAAYMWKNYLDNGEDDVRAIHAGCGSTKSLKVIGTFFIRDWPGPYKEQDSFWDWQDMQEPLPDPIDEAQRQLELRMLWSFRLRHLEALYAEQRRAAHELAGPRAAVWQARRQLLHLASLEAEELGEEVEKSIGEMQEQYAGVRLSWSKVVPVDGAF